MAHSPPDDDATPANPPRRGPKRGLRPWATLRLSNAEDAPRVLDSLARAFSAAGQPVEDRARPRGRWLTVDSSRGPDLCLEERPGEPTIAVSLFFPRRDQDGGPLRTLRSAARALGVELAVDDASG